MRVVTTTSLEHLQGTGLTKEAGEEMRRKSVFRHVRLCPNIHGKSLSPLQFSIESAMAKKVVKHVWVDVASVEITSLARALGWCGGNDYSHYARGSRSTIDGCVKFTGPLLSDAEFAEFLINQGWVVELEFPKCPLATRLKGEYAAWSRQQRLVNKNPNALPRGLAEVEREVIDHLSVMPGVHVWPNRSIPVNSDKARSISRFHWLRSSTQDFGGSEVEHERFMYIFKSEVTRSELQKCPIVDAIMTQDGKLV